jgi:hypothetical protein
MQKVKMFIACVVALAVSAFGADWPREFDSPKGRIVVYEPQIESSGGDSLTGRSAFSVTPAGQTEPVFGAFWWRGRTLTDRDARTVDLIDLVVTQVKLPDATQSTEREFAALIEREAPSWNLTFSLDNLLASIEVANKEQQTAEELSTSPPRIVVVQYPAVLVVIDGKPELRTIEQTDLMRVVNTPFLIVLDQGSGEYYLSGGSYWYRSRDINGPWQNIPEPPSRISDLVPPDSGRMGEAPGTQPPRIIIVTEPTELISTDGVPLYTPITGTDLLYISNTDADVFKDIPSQKIYALFSGRWYSSRSLNGPWTFAPPDRLPAGFKRIPPESEKGHVLADVAGTQQAQDALADAQIPQTTAINRTEAHLDVTYDGEPRFEPIPGTSIDYAVNTGSSVLLIKRRYYACDQGVWFVSSGPRGPWLVSDERPEGVDAIPPSVPVYNVKYVYVYRATPEVVYVGYTPGYLGCYPYHGTIFYGTGYHYRPWIGAIYYPRPVTWGFCFHYNFSAGWGFGLRYSAVFVRVGTAFGAKYYGRYHSGWWGPPGYRPPVYRPVVRTRNVTVVRTTTNIYRQPANESRNMYRVTGRTRTQPVESGKRENNVYVGRNGNIYRQTTGGWQQRQGNKWSTMGRVTPKSTPAAPAPAVEKPSRGERPAAATRASPGSRAGSVQQPPTRLERDVKVRQRSASREGGAVQKGTQREGKSERKAERKKDGRR